MKIKLKTKPLLFLALALLLASLAVSILILYNTKGLVRRPDGTSLQPTDPYIVASVVRGQLIFTPLLSLALGAVVTLLIDRHLPYRRRFLKGFLLTLAVLNGIFLLSGLVKLGGLLLGS